MKGDRDDDLSPEEGEPEAMDAFLEALASSVRPEEIDPARHDAILARALGEVAEDDEEPSASESETRRATTLRDLLEGALRAGDRGVTESESRLVLLVRALRLAYAPTAVDQVTNERLLRPALALPSRLAARRYAGATAFVLVAVAAAFALFLRPAKPGTSARRHPCASDDRRAFDDDTLRSGRAVPQGRRNDVARRQDRSEPRRRDAREPLRIVGGRMSARRVAGRGRRRLAAVVAALALVASGCGRDTSASPEPLSTSVVNPVIHAFLSKARSAHHLADLAEESHDTKQAIEALKIVTEGMQPPMTPEVAEVLADTHARIAELLSEEGDVDDALHEIDLGLDLASEPSNFRGHLFEVRGVVEERQSKTLAKQGDAAGAAAAKERAKTAFERAIDVQEETIYRAIGVGTASPPR